MAELALPHVELNIWFHGFSYTIPHLTAIGKRIYRITLHYVHTRLNYFAYAYTIAVTSDGIL